ncbi:DUF1345 domain-containing protein [Nakamurella antarctica]|uniref:DUF1345 domain-containing protein n=1 Tax=Nakamurella antarctica TaxID=1902245 RepID=A0A3G8ZR30_9ACTN|nr:DUF1345 domain-containing protein [Nakamurella antarctica]AZI59257.1 DUF1345 domain-containing protein [Nakamurella antarctica]
MAPTSGAHGEPRHSSFGYSTSTLQRLLACASFGVVGGLTVGLLSRWQYGLLSGWMVGAAAFILWTWLTLWPLDAEATSDHALREDPGRAKLDVVVVAASVASLGAVGILLAEQQTSGSDIAIGVISVALAWALVHTVYATRYAAIYYSDTPGGIDFNEKDPPQYSDFAYLSFTIGMTYQVSDTAFNTKAIRATALRHALLSFVFGAIILATTINLVASVIK